MSSVRPALYRFATAIAVALMLPTGQTAADEEGAGGAVVTIGSKKFTESVILGEMIARLVQAGGSTSVHMAELGGTAVLWNALISGEIDAYAEYTGTLRHELFAGRDLSDDVALADALARSGVRMSRPLGFNNTYAIGVKEEIASRMGIEAISDLERRTTSVASCPRAGSLSRRS